MFEGQVAYYLNRYLGRYLQGIDADSLRISVWRGDVELRNLALKPEALQDLELPVTVKAGLLGRLTLKVPWKALGREPVVVEFDRLYILVAPKEQQQTSQQQQASQQPEGAGSEGACGELDVSCYEAEVAAAELAERRQRVLAAETGWLQDLQTKLGQKLSAEGEDADAEAAAAAAAPKKGGGGGGGGGLFNLQALMHTILGNLQLRLSNVHVRYEDAASLPGQTLAAGVTLAAVAAHTVDEAGREAFVTDNVLHVLRKAVALQELGVYFDVGRPLLQPPATKSGAGAGGDWLGLPIYEWDALMLPSRHTPTSTSSDAATASAVQPVYEHHFLISPISGDMAYVRRSSKALATAAVAAAAAATAATTPGDGATSASATSSSSSSQQHQQFLLPARQQARICLRSVSLAITRPQYIGVRALLETLDAYTANAPYRAMRPKCRPAEGDAARIWWRYAFRAVRKQLTRGSSRCSWGQLRTACLLRKQYVPAYVRYLTTGSSSVTGAVGGATGGGGTAGTAGGGGGVTGGGTAGSVVRLGGDEGIAALDAQLPEGTILLFRRMAHAKLQSQRSAQAASSTSPATSSPTPTTTTTPTPSAAPPPQPLPPPASSPGGGGGAGGWWAWFRGSGGSSSGRMTAAAAAAATSTPALTTVGSGGGTGAAGGVGLAGLVGSGGSSGGESGSLSAEEWERLQELLQQQEYADDEE
ncbi:hypothetical protein Agub_g14841, partial [Astrephomene gubernaculifera]